MPIIPATRNLPNQISIGGPGSIRPLLQGLNEAATLLQRVEDAEDDVKVAEFSTTVATTLNRVLRDPTIREPEELAQKYETAQKESAQALSSLTGSPRLRRKAAIALQGVLKANDDNFQTRHNQARIDSGKASIERSKLNLVEMYRDGRADHDGVLLSYRALLAQGFHSKEEALKLEREFDNGLVLDLIDRDPALYYQQKAAGVYSRFSPEEIRKLDSAANAGVTERITASNRVATTVKEKARKFLLDAARDKKLDSPEITQFIEDHIGTNLTSEDISIARKLQDGEYTSGGTETQAALLKAQALAESNDLNDIALAKSMVMSHINRGEWGPNIGKSFLAFQVLGHIASVERSVKSYEMRAGQQDYTRARQHVINIVAAHRKIAVGTLMRQIEQGKADQETNALLTEINISPYPFETARRIEAEYKARKPAASGGITVTPRSQLEKYEDAKSTP